MAASKPGSAARICFAVSNAIYEWRGLVADLHRHLLVASLVVMALAGGYMYWKVRRR